MASDTLSSVAQPAADFIQKRAPGFTPQMGIILGSGMGDVATSTWKIRLYDSHRKSREIIETIGLLAFSRNAVWQMFLNNF